MRMAGQHIIEQVNHDLTVMAQQQQKIRQKMEAQRRRDMAAAAGETIPFEAWEFQ